MRQSGIQQDTIKIGDRITMNVMLALDGSHHAATVFALLVAGRGSRTTRTSWCPGTLAMILRTSDKLCDGLTRVATERGCKDAEQARCQRTPET
jgi:hypothetical protein